MTAILTVDGQITLPSALREQLGWVAGQALELQAQSDRIVIWKKTEDPFEKWRGRGCLPAGSRVDEYLPVIRDDYSS